MSNAKEVLNNGDTNKIGAAMKAAGLGSVLCGENGYWTVGETVPVASAAAIPKYTIKKLLYARTIGTGAPAEKATTGLAGSAPGTGAAAPASDGKSVVFNAETTGTGTAELIYITTDKVNTGGDVPRVGLTENIPGIVV